MTFGQMKESLKTIKLLEKDLMRDLTKEEKDIVVSKGWEEFLFNHLGFSEDDFKEVKAIKAIISAFYTQDEEVFTEAVRTAPKEVYFVLRDILDKMEGLELCANPECNTDSAEVSAEDEYEQFMADLYNSLPETEKKWFTKLPEDTHKKLLAIYKECRNEQQDCGDDVLGGIITDAVKDEVVKAMVKDLKEGKTVDMTGDEYLEVAAYLCEHEDRVFLHNENGNVRLINF